jgi:alpha-soluble NSF attachment protein
MGRFSIAAKHHQTIAEIYESELADLDRAVQHYEQAADYFKGSIVFFDILNISNKILY